MDAPKIAFVATGGASRGLAHLGVLRACEELGVKPDIFIGTSSGAIVVAAYGQGVPLDVLLDGYRLPWNRRHDGLRVRMRTLLGLPRVRDFSDPGYLVSGAFSIDDFEQHLRRHLPVNDFRLVENRVIVTAVDLDRGARVLFGRGYDDDTPISVAVAASCCAPGLFRPYSVKGRYLIDGELARTLSADVAVDAGADVVIISNVYRPFITRPGARSVARRGVVKVLHQTLNIVLTEKEKRGVDLYSRVSPRTAFIDIAPDIGMFGYLSRFNARAFVMRGYRAGLRALVAAKEGGVFERSRHPRPTALN